MPRCMYYGCKLVLGHHDGCKHKNEFVEKLREEIEHVEKDEQKNSIDNTY